MPRPTQLNALGSNAVLDARDRFRPGGLEYTVQINVQVSGGFLWAVAKCVWQRKKLRITHKFTNDPLMHNVEVSGARNDD